MRLDSFITSLVIIGLLSPLLCSGRKSFFIDLGGNEGLSLAFSKRIFPCMKDFTVHTFECNPELAKHFTHVTGFKSFTFHPECVWTDNDGVSFRIMTESLGSTLRSDKATGGRTKQTLSLPSVDFSEWLNSTVSPEDFVVLKMDVEGAEFDVLPKMSRDNTLRLVDVFFGEWHGPKLRPPLDDSSLDWLLLKAGLKKNYWEAETSSVDQVDICSLSHHRDRQRETYAAIERRIDEIDDFTRTYLPSYRLRFQGIAAPKYTTIKTRFIFDTLHRHRWLFAKNRVQVCEIGFNAGHSSVLFLEALPNSHMVSFDLNDHRWTPKNAEWVDEHYPGRFTFVQGDSSSTLPAYRKSHHLKCDVVFADGGKNEQLRYKDLLELKRASGPRTVVFFDEVNDPKCVSGELSREARPCQRHTWEGTTYAYQTLSREKELHVQDCVMALKGDGICWAKFHE